MHSIIYVFFKMKVNNFIFTKYSFIFFTRIMYEDFSILPMSWNDLKHICKNLINIEWVENMRSSLIMIAPEGRNIVTRRLTLSVLPSIMHGKFLRRQCSTQRHLTLYIKYILSILKFSMYSSPSSWIHLKLSNQVEFCLKLISKIKLGSSPSSSALHW